MSASWKRKIDVEKGEMGVIDVPERNQSIIVFKAPAKGTFLLFQTQELGMKWLAKHKRDVQSLFDVARPQPIAIPPELLAPFPGTIPSQVLETDLNTQLENLRKRRLQSLGEDKDGDQDKGEEQVKDGIAM